MCQQEWKSNHPKKNPNHESKQSLISHPALPIKSHTWELIEEHFMFVYHSLNFPVLSLFHLGWGIHSLNPLLSLCLSHCLQELETFPTRKLATNRKHGEMEKWNISLKLTQTNAWNPNFDIARGFITAWAPWQVHAQIHLTPLASLMTILAE